VIVNILGCRACDVVASRLSTDKKDFTTLEFIELQDTIHDETNVETKSIYNRFDMQTLIGIQRFGLVCTITFTPSTYEQCLLFAASYTTAHA